MSNPKIRVMLPAFYEKYLPVLRAMDEETANAFFESGNLNLDFDPSPVDGMKLRSLWKSGDRWQVSYRSDGLVDVDYEAIISEVKKHVDNRPKYKVKILKKKKKIGVFGIADLHIGANIIKLKITKDFSIKKVIDYLSQVASDINSKDYSEVHISILGDLIESFQGNNHPGVWKDLAQGGHGSQIIITAYEILISFLSQVNNLKCVYMVSGNHDRLTNNKSEDPKGGVCEILSYFINDKINATVKFDAMLLSEAIDGINYVMTHGHLGVAKKTDYLLFNYGKQGMFNVILTGHLHTKKKKEQTQSFEMVNGDSSRYVALTCRSIFTGNFYSEGLGFTSIAGFTELTNKGGLPLIIDEPLF